MLTNTEVLEASMECKASPPSRYLGLTRRNLKITRVKGQPKDLSMEPWLLQRKWCLLDLEARVAPVGEDPLGEATTMPGLGKGRMS